MRLMLAGDIHASRTHAGSLFEHATAHDVDAIFALGDFGYWPRWAGGHRFLKRVEDLTQHSGVTMYWLDGNHEDHEMLRRHHIGDGFIPTHIPYRTNRPETPRFFYSPRGHAWTWGRYRFMSMGGAYSTDRKWRSLGEDYFLEETITDEDVDRATAQGPIDILLTHDTPGLTERLTDLVIEHGREDKFDPEAKPNREQLARVIDVARPSHLFHGHYHINYSEQLDGIRITGLGRDGSGVDSWTIIDTGTDPADWS